MSASPMGRTLLSRAQQRTVSFASFLPTVGQGPPSKLAQFGFKGCAPSSIQLLNVLQPYEGCPAVCKSQGEMSGRKEWSGEDKEGLMTMIDNGDLIWGLVGPNIPESGRAASRPTYRTSVGTHVCTV